jgi:hypothetical protein
LTLASLSMRNKFAGPVMVIDGGQWRLFLPKKSYWQ